MRREKNGAIRFRAIEARDHVVYRGAVSIFAACETDLDLRLVPQVAQFVDDARAHGFICGTPKRMGLIISQDLLKKMLRANCGELTLGRAGWFRGQRFEHNV